MASKRRLQDDDLFAKRTPDNEQRLD